jgi:hypothetical protein
MFSRRKVANNSPQIDPEIVMAVADFVQANPGILGGSGGYHVPDNQARASPVVFQHTYNVSAIDGPNPGGNSGRNLPMKAGGNAGPVVCANADPVVSARAAGSAGGKAGGNRIYNSVLGRYLNPFEYLTVLQFILLTALLLGYVTKDTKLKDVCPAIPEGEWTIPGPTPITVDARLFCESIFDPLFRFFPATKEMKTQKALRMVDRALSRKESLRNGYLSVEFFQGLLNQSIQDLNLEDLQNCIDDGELNFTCVNQTVPVETLRTPSGRRQMPKPNSPPRQVIEEFLECSKDGNVSIMCLTRSKPIMEMFELSMTDEEFARRDAAKGFVLKNSTDFDKAAEEAGYFRNNTEHFEVAVEASGYFKKNTAHFIRAAGDSGFVLKDSLDFDFYAKSVGFFKNDSQEFFDATRVSGYVKEDVLVNNNRKKVLAHGVANVGYGLVVAVVYGRLHTISEKTGLINPGPVDVIFGTILPWFYANPTYGTVLVATGAAVIKKFLDDYIDTWI